MLDPESNGSTLLVVDDDSTFRRGLVRLLTAAGHRCREAATAAEARTVLEDHAAGIDLILCDIRMPGELGLDLIPDVLADHPELAVVMITAITDPAVAALAVEIGADAYLVKPFERTEVLVAIAAARKRRALELARRALATGHERAVQRTRMVTAALDHATGQPAIAPQEVIDRLSRAISLRHEETAQHLQRMSHYTVVLAEAAGMGRWPLDDLRLAAALHDVGKIGVPDSVLLKPAPLTAPERAVIQKHASYGYRLLAGSEAPVIRLAATIALGHHEWWDGGGYPLGLQGAEIADPARLVAITDVFDALTSNRVYRPRFSFDEAVEIMRAQRGTHFEPRLLDAFFESLSTVAAIAAEFPDRDPDDARIRVMIVDDHEIFVDSLVRRLAVEDDLVVAGVAATVRDAVRGTAAHQPDVILMDFELPDGTGAEAAEQVKQLAPEVRIVMLTGRTDQATVVRAVSAGCSGFVTKTEGAERLMQAIRSAHAGEAVTSVDELLPLLAQLRGSEWGLGESLSAREVEVLELMASGLPNKAIAERLFISVHTVRNHVQRILEKLQVHSKLEAVAVGVREGIVSIPSS